MATFVFKFLLTSIFFSLIIGAALLRRCNNRHYSTAELILYSMGLGPVFTVLLLYYFLLLIPGLSHSFYLVSILTLFALTLVFSLRGFHILGLRLFHWFKSSASSWRSLPPKEKTKNALFWGFLLALGTGFLFLYLGNTLHTPIEHHDALVYGNYGKMYFQQKQIYYSKVMRPARNGFYFQGSQRPSFSLLLTWEMLLNSDSINQKPYFDMYFRSISGYFGLLVISLCFYWLFKKNKYLALLGLLVLFSGLQFFLMLVNYHLDSYRLFFLLVSWIWLAYTIKERDNFALFLLGVFSGLAGFTHLIGLVAALVNGLALFIFYEGDFKTRFRKTAALALMILVLGNFHYLLEVFFGSVSGFISYL